VSGVQVPYPLFRAEVSGNPLLTGGDYGPEGSLLTTAVIVLVTGYLVFSKSIYISEKTRAFVFAPAAKTDLPETSLRLDATDAKTSGDPPRLN
jgi:hypothetical protein